MFEVLGEEYYIDIDKIIENCKPTKKQGNPAGDEEDELMDSFKFDCYKSCMDRVVSEYEDDDGDVAAFTSKSRNPGFAIAFNTLLKHEIIKKDE